MVDLTKIADDKFIKVTLEDEGLEVSIRYNKRSTLEKRFILLDKLKDVLRKI